MTTIDHEPLDAPDPRPQASCEGDDLMEMQPVSMVRSADVNLGALLKGSAKRAIESRNERQRLIQGVLIENVDWGVIPGCGAKPALFKPGAEKAIDALNIRPVYDTLERMVDWDKEIIFYRYRCRLVIRGTDIEVCQGIGSCNSRESKYRYRWIWRSRLTEAQMSAALEFKPARNSSDDKDGEYKFENEDVMNQLNTIDKMGQKRALVAAVLNLGFSDTFTQDIDDNPEAFGGSSGRAENTTEASPARSTTRPTRSKPERSKTGSSSNSAATPGLPDEDPENPFSAVVVYTDMDSVLTLMPGMGRGKKKVPIYLISDEVLEKHLKNARDKNYDSWIAPIEDEIGRREMYAEHELQNAVG